MEEMEKLSDCKRGKTMRWKKTNPSRDGKHTLIRLADTIFRKKEIIR